MVEQVSLIDLEPFAARIRDHVSVCVDAARLDLGVAEQAEQLAPSTAQVEHRCGPAKVLDVTTLALADQLDAAPHPALEGEVVGHGGRALLRGHRRSRSRRGAGNARTAASLEPGEALLELAGETLRLLASAAAVSARSDSASMSFSTASLKIRWSAARGSTYQRMSLRRTRLTKPFGPRPRVAPR